MFKDIDTPEIDQFHHCLHPDFYGYKKPSVIRSKPLKRVCMHTKELLIDQATRQHRALKEEYSHTRCTKCGEYGHARKFCALLDPQLPYTESQRLMINFLNALFVCWA